LRIAGGTVKSPIPERWRERNPWLAFEDGYRHVRGFVQRLESGSLGALEARFGTDLRSLVEGSNNAIARVMTPGALDREAAALLPLETLLGPAIRAPWSWQAAALRRSLEAVEPHLAKDARVILLLDHGGAEALVAAVLGGVGAGYRLVEARLTDPDDE